MYSAASGWLMTDLNPDPFIVSMVQVATTLPMFLFALPAGALAQRGRDDDAEAVHSGSPSTASR